jgi:UPF0755 protein
MLEPDDFTGPGTGQAKVKIEPGSSGRAIARVLAAAGVIKTQKAFVDSPEAVRAARIQPGTYLLRRQMSASAAIGLMLDPKARVELSVTVPEGKRVSETLAILTKQLGIPRSAFDAALKDPASIGLTDASARGSAEGFLFPSTYTFAPDVTATEVLRSMTKLTAKALRDAAVPEARWREVIVRASIVQKEAGKSADMPKVARVLDNRLAKEPRKLELDSTVSYGTGKFAITTTQADRLKDGPYNTYLRPGLPAGPISSPGEEAIDAVMHPAAGPWMYFVTVDPNTGDTRFAVTYEEHLKNVRLFQAWLARQKK